MAEVLVVDDSRVYRDLVGVLLENEGIDVRAAADGEGALAMLRERKPDAIIVDLAMPGIDGIELLKRIRDDWLAPDAYIVVLTADDDPTKPAEVEALGAAELVTKPFDPDRFVAGLRAHMATRHATTPMAPTETPI